MELRCSSKMHGKLYDNVIEVQCGSKFCGARPGVAVLHLFHKESGVLLDTRKKEEGKTS